MPRDIGRTVRYLAVKATQKIAVSLEGIPELTLIPTKIDFVSLMGSGEGETFPGCMRRACA